jgi:hypothetical protein
MSTKTQLFSQHSNRLLFFLLILNLTLSLLLVSSFVAFRHVWSCVQGNVSYMVPNIAMMSFVSYFFSGFVCLKMPFSMPSTHFKVTCS